MKTTWPSFFLIFFVLLYFPSLRAQESQRDLPRYFILTVQSSAIDFSKGTRVLVAGEGHGEGEGELFQETAASLAHKYQEAYPEEQVLLFFPLQGSLSSQLRRISNWRLQIVKQGFTDLGITELLSQLNLLNDHSLHALHFFAHAWQDLTVLQGEDWLTIWSDVSALQERLSSDAYIVIHGCNAGWSLAPYLARTLQVPVAGALTSTNFEQLHSSGNFYFNDNETKPAGPWAKSNLISYSKARPCSQGACLRMKPDNHPYLGLHGELPQGLPFYKFFCPYGLYQESCERIMATALIGWIDLIDLNRQSSEEDFKMVARNWLCPISNVTNIRSECLKALIKAESVSDPQIDAYSPFRGPLVQCDSYSCWESESEYKPDTFVREYRAFLKGIRELKQEP